MTVGLFHLTIRTDPFQKYGVSGLIKNVRIPVFLANSVDRSVAAFYGA